MNKKTNPLSELMRNETSKMALRLHQLKLKNIEKETTLLGITNGVMNMRARTDVNYNRCWDSQNQVKLKFLMGENDIGIERWQPGTNGLSMKHNLKQINHAEILSSKCDDANGEGNHTRAHKNIGGQKCGQCDETDAAVNCKECAEVYCAKCFTTFHFRGALRRHRSTPIFNISKTMSLFRPPDLINVLNNSAGDKKVRVRDNKPQKSGFKNKKETSKIQKIDKSICKGQSQRQSNVSLADGTYNETLSTNYFKDALMAWRNDKEAPYKPLSRPPMSLIERSTETMPTKVNYKLLADSFRFSPVLSYADQLILRKHRSCQMVPVEMNHILSRLTYSNDADLLEHEKLLQSNLRLETAALNDPMVNGISTDWCQPKIESLSELWSDAVFISGRDQYRDSQLLPNLHLEIEDVVSSTETCTKYALKTEDSKSDQSLTEESNQNNDSNATVNTTHISHDYENIWNQSPNSNFTNEILSIYHKGCNEQSNDLETGRLSSSSMMTSCTNELHIFKLLDNHDLDGSNDNCDDDHEVSEPIEEYHKQYDTYDNEVIVPYLSDGHNHKRDFDMIKCDKFHAEDSFDFQHNSFSDAMSYDSKEELQSYSSMSKEHDDVSNVD